LKEEHRQLAHVAAGLAVILLVVFIGKQEALLALIALISAGMLFGTLKLLGFTLGPLEHLLEQFERKKTLMPFQGAIMFAVGSLFALTFAPTLSFGVAAIAILAFGDGFATYFGIKGTTKVHWNPRKTWRGLFAFAIAGGLAAAPFIGLAAFGYSTVLAFVESVDVGVDDNLVIPVAAVVVKLI